MSKPIKDDGLLQEAMLTYHRAFKAWVAGNEAGNLDTKAASAESRAFVDRHGMQAILLLAAYKSIMDSFHDDGVKAKDVNEAMLLARAFAIHEAKTVAELKALSDAKVGLHVN